MHHHQKKLSKRQKRQTEKENNFKSNFQLKEIDPITETQKQVFDKYDEDKHLMLIGSAGTGKSFLSLYLALDDILNEKIYQKLIIIRSVVPTRNIGYLPGSASEKIRIFEAPYQAICTELFDREDAYSILKQKRIIEFMSTSFIRGITLNDSIIVIDEFQNANFEELFSAITRVGQGCKLILCGDINQNDLIHEKDTQASGFKKMYEILKMVPDFDIVEFSVNDICRSEFVKNLIIAKEKYEREVEFVSS